MNEFLHNLRTKNKRYDGNRRQYPNSQYPDRRNVKDNRKQQQAMNVAVEQLSTALSENLPVVKNLLENISENQKRLAQAEERRAKAEERKAAVLETIVDFARLWLGGKVDLPDLSSLKSDIQDDLETQSSQKVEEQQNEDVAEAAPDTDNSPDSDQERDGQFLSREAVMDIIRDMREENITYDQIARHLEQRGVPTFSGKGKWRGQTVHRLYQKITE